MDVFGSEAMGVVFKSLPANCIAMKKEKMYMLCNTINCLAFGS